MGEVINFMEFQDNNIYSLNLKYITDYEKFYNTYNIEELDFNNINDQQYENIKDMAKKLDIEVCSKMTIIKDSPSLSLGYVERIKQSKIMSRLILSPMQYNANTNEEAILTYILCVDPNFVAIGLFNKYKDDMKVLKKELINYFGMYDNNIINIIMSENKILKSIDPIVQKQIKLESSKELKKVLKK